MKLVSDKPSHQTSVGVNSKPSKKQKTKNENEDRKVDNKNLFQNGSVKKVKITEKNLQANTARSIQRLVTFPCVFVSTPKVFVLQTA